MIRIALLGEDLGRPSHRELNALAPRLAEELDVDVSWLPTDADPDPTRFHGLWLVPGAPYRDDAAALRALTVAREGGIPFLGTCSGLQYAAVEYARNVLGRAATNAEIDGTAEDNVVIEAACSLQGEIRTVVPVPGSRFATMVDAPFEGMHYCSYQLTGDVVRQLERSGVVVGARAEDAPIEVLEFPRHPFYLASLFQPQIGVASGGAVHPLIREFVRAAGEYARHGPVPPPSPPSSGHDTPLRDVR